MAAKKRVLLLGSSGFLGWNFLFHSPDVHWVCPMRATSVGRLPAGIEAMPMVDWSELQGGVVFWQKLMEEQGIDAVINTVAIADARVCQESPEMAFHINVDVPCQMAVACNAMNIPFVHCSSDLTFDGANAPYGNEQCGASPLSIYGEHKKSSEVKVLEAWEKAWVIRLPLLFGESSSLTRNGFRQMTEALLQGECLTLFSDEFRSPARAKRIVHFVMAKLGRESGLLNLGGPERLSRYQMGERLVDVFGGDMDQLKSLTQEELDLGAPRPKDVSLDSSKARAMGYEHGLFLEELMDIRDSGGWRMDHWKV